MDKSNFFENAICNINEFYMHQYNEANAEKLIFETLNKLIQFSCGRIYIQSLDECEVKYKYGSSSGGNSIREDLSINGCKFGYIEISRENSFSYEEITVFKTCSVIIANIIKDIELSEIVKMQVKALQDGIEETKRQNKKIIAADKVKNSFLANVSHELRSPLNSILGFSELLREQLTGKLNEKQLEYVSDIRIASLHLLGMINEILDISKIESNAVKLNLTEFRLKQNAEEVLNILKPLYEKKNISTSLNIQEEIIIRADYQKIQQIFFNLINNAIKFTHENGKISVSSKTASNNLIIYVSDNGIGIEKKYLNKIFKKFVQVNQEASKESSTGLGLTITKELVKLHGGTISVESKPAEGTTFIIKIQNVVI